MNTKLVWPFIVFLKNWAILFLNLPRDNPERLSQTCRVWGRWQRRWWCGGLKQKKKKSAAMTTSRPTMPTKDASKSFKPLFSPAFPVSFRIAHSTGATHDPDGHIMTDVFPRLEFGEYPPKEREVLLWLYRCYVGATECHRRRCCEGRVASSASLPRAAARGCSCTEDRCTRGTSTESPSSMPREGKDASDDNPP